MTQELLRLLIYMASFPLSLSLFACVALWLGPQGCMITIQSTYNRATSKVTPNEVLQIQK